MGRFRELRPRTHSFGNEPATYPRAITDEIDNSELDNC